MIDFFSSFLLYRILQTRVNCQRRRELKQFLPFSCLDCTGDLLHLYCGIVLCLIIHFTDKLKPSTDKFPSYYINVKFFKKSVKTCDDQKPFPKSCDKKRSPPDIQPNGVFSPHKPRQIACVGFVWLGRVPLPKSLSRDTGLNRLIDSLLIHNTCVNRHFMLN